MQEINLYNNEPVRCNGSKVEFTNLKENSLVLIYISLKISYVSLQINSLGCFDEVREECGWSQDTKGFCVNSSREVGIVAKGHNLHHSR